MNYIEELYAGNINPSFQQVKKGSKYDKLTKQESELRKKLSQILSDDDKKLLEKICDIKDDIDYITAFDNYAMGFRDGSRLMMDILLGRNENLNSQ